MDANLLFTIYELREFLLNLNPLDWHSKGTWLLLALGSWGLRQWDADVTSNLTGTEMGWLKDRHSNYHVWTIHEISESNTKIKHYSDKTNDGAAVWSPKKRDI
jgi:hypothetical protein